MEPINYLAQVADPFAEATKGLQLGAGMAELQQKQALIAKQQQQQQLAMQEQAKFFTNPNPTMRDAARYASLLSPEQSKAFLPFMEGISKEQQQNTLKSTGKVLSALQTNPQIGIQLLQDRATAARNSGDIEDATLFDQMALAAADPNQGPGAVFKSLAARTAGIPGAKEFFENIDKSASTARLEALAPSALRTAVAGAGEAESKAITAAVQAKFADSKAVQDLALTKAQIENYAATQEIAKQNNRIAAMNAQAAKEGNALKREELQLKIDETKRARDQAVLDKHSQTQTVLATFDNTMSTVDKLLDNFGKTKEGKPNLDLTNSTIKSATGPLNARSFTINQDVANFEEQVATLQSQVFLSQVEKMKGLGALTEREGAKLESALASLSLRQSPKQLGSNLITIKDLIEKARQNAEGKFGVTQSTAPATATAAPPAASQPPAAVTGMPAGFRVIRPGQ